jgi:hypothetical protein
MSVEAEILSRRINRIVELSDPHAVWTSLPGDADFSLRWRLIKSRFAQVAVAPAASCAKCW